LALKLESIIAKQAEKRTLAGKKIDPVEILPQGKTRDQLEKGSEEQKENLRKNSEKIFHVASEIKDKEKREERDRQAEEQRKQRENATVGENGWKFQFYIDKWGNKWVHETKEGENLIEGSEKDKDAYWWRNRIVKYNPEYKKAYDSQVGYELGNILSEFNSKLKQITWILNRLGKKHDLKEIKKAYVFDKDRPREGWDHWGNEGGLELQPGNPPPINIEKDKRFLWPEIVSLYEKIQQSWNLLQP